MKNGIDVAIGVIILLVTIVVGGLIFVQIGANIPQSSIGTQVHEGISIISQPVTLTPNTFAYQTVTSNIPGAKIVVFNSITTFTPGIDYSLTAANGTLTELAGGQLYNTSQTIYVNLLTYQTSNYPVVTGTLIMSNSTEIFGATDYNLTVANGTITILAAGKLFNSTQTLKVSYVWEGGDSWSGYNQMISSGWSAFTLLAIAAFVGAAVDADWHWRKERGLLSVSPSFLSFLFFRCGFRRNHSHGKIRDIHAQVQFGDHIYFILRACPSELYDPESLCIGCQFHRD